MEAKPWTNSGIMVSTEENQYHFVWLQTFEGFLSQSCIQIKFRLGIKKHTEEWPSRFTKPKKEYESTNISVLDDRYIC